MPIGCRNWQSCTFPSTVPSFLSQQAKTSTSPLLLIVHRAARFWLPERINLWAKTCQHAWLIFPLNFFQRNFPHNVTGKCIPHADACCRSFSMNTHTTWFLACLPLSARCHPFPLEKRQSLETIAAYTSSSSVHSVLSKDGCLSNFRNGFYRPLCYPKYIWIWGMKGRSVASPLFLKQSPRMAGRVA